MPTFPITDLEKEAFDFAKEKHEGQIRKFSNGLSYFDAHVQKVFGRIKQYDLNPILGCVALLHDVIEDPFKDNQEEGIKLIRKNFGEEVLSIVLELTSDKKLVKKFGKKEYLYSKMLVMSNEALLVKLCDRFENISDAFTADESFRFKYYNETRYIMDRLTTFRKMNVIQMRAANDIVSKLNNIQKLFKY